MFLILNLYLNIIIYIHDETPNTLITNYILTYILNIITILNLNHY